MLDFVQALINLQEVVRQAAAQHQGFAQKVRSPLVFWILFVCFYVLMLIRLVFSLEGVSGKSFPFYVLFISLVLYKVLKSAILC